MEDNVDYNESEDEAPILPIASTSDVALNETKIQDLIVDPAEWKLEVERVTPNLKVHIQNDNKDWRLHAQQLKQYESELMQYIAPAVESLQKIETEVDKTLEKITSREKYLNQQMEKNIEVYRQTKEVESQVKRAYESSIEQVAILSNELAQVTEDLDRLKVKLKMKSSIRLKWMK
jgi:estrogen-related receptor beta like 1